MPSLPHITLHSNRVVPVYEYAVTGFNATNFLKTQFPGGEVGVGTGFGAVILGRLTSKPSTSAQRMVFTSRTAAAVGWGIETNGNRDNIKIAFGNGTSAIASPVYTWVASDVGKVFLFIGIFDAALAKFSINRIEPSTGTAFTGAYSVSTAATSIGCLNGSGGLPETDGIEVLSCMTFTGVLSSSQMLNLYDGVRATGDLPSAITVVSNTSADVDALLPIHRYKASVNTLNAGNLSTLTNLGTAGGNLAVSAGTVAAPANDALFNNQQSFALTGTQWLDSSLAASNFAFLHNGNGHDVFIVWAPTADTSQYIYATDPGAATTQLGIVFSRAVGGNVRFFAGNGTNALFDVQAGNTPVNTATFTRTTYSESLSPHKVRLFNRVSVQAQANSGAAPSASDPTGFRLGAGTTGTAPASAKIAELIMFNRALSDSEIAILENYARVTYNIGGVTPTHLWSTRKALSSITTPAGRKLSGATSFATSPATGYQTANGLVGAATGFWGAAVVNISTATNNSSLVWKSSGATGYVLDVFSGAVRLTVQGSSAVAISSPIQAALRPCLVVWHHDGANLRLYMGRAQVATAAITGYNVPSVAMKVGQVGGGWDFYELAGGNFSPSLAEIQALFDTFDTTGKLGTIPSKTDHRWSVDEDLSGGALSATLTDKVGVDSLSMVGTLGITAYTATAPAAPQSLPDLITGAAADIMTRVGTPAASVFSATTDGRRTLGAQGFSVANRLESAAGAGIRGAAGGFHVYASVIIQSLVGNDYFVSCANGAVTNGFAFYRTGSTLFLYCGNGSTSISRTRALTSADVGRLLLIHLNYNGTAMEGFVDGVSMSSIANVTPYVPADNSVKMVIGDLPLASSPATAENIYVVGGGNSSLSQAEITAHALATAAAGGRAPALIGKDDHYYDLTQDILAAGETVPAQVLDRVGTDHLTRQGIAVQTDADAIRSVGPYGTADSWQTVSGGGIQGANTGFHVLVDVWLTKIAASDEYVAHCTTSASGTNGWLLRVGNGIRATIGGVVVSASYTVTSGDLNKRLRILVQKTATALQLYVQGVQVGSDVACASYNAPNVAMVIGHVFGTLAFGSGYVELVQGGNTILTAGEIATLHANLTQPPPVIAGKTLKRYRLEDDIAAAGGVLPSLSVERISGGDSLVRSGAPLQVAQRTERLWSYDSAPLQYGAEGLSDTAYYSRTDGGVVGDPTGWWYAMPIILLSQSVPSNTRVLAGINSAAGGWDVRVTGTNAVMQPSMFDGSGVLRTGPTFTFTSADIGKLLLHVIVWDAAAGRLRGYLRRVESGTGTAVTGYTKPAAGAIFKVGKHSQTDGSSATGWAILGDMGGLGIPTLAEVQAAHDAFMAKEDLVAIPGKTAFYFSILQDVKANGGVLPATLLDRIGTSNLSRNGTPNLSSVYARSYGW